MKKFSLIVILYFNILPIWKNNEIFIFHLNTIAAQDTKVVLKNYLTSTSTNGHTFATTNHGCGCQVVERDAAGHFIKNHNSNEVYLSNPAYRQYASGQGVTPPPPSSNEYPEDDDIDWEQIGHDLDMLRFETRMQMFAEIVWFNEIGGNEPQNPQPPCEESMYNISPLDDDFYEGKAMPFINQAPISLTPPNNPCSNNFFIGGNIIHFNTPQLANISNYNFFDNKLHSVDMSGNRHYRAIYYDVIESKTQYDSYSSYCPDDHYDSTYLLLNKRGSYQFICFDNLPVEGLRHETYTGVGFFKDVPLNEPFISFTIPDSAIVPAQAGNSVLGINSSNNLVCQTLDCAKVANGTASNDNCGACTGGTTGAQPCTQTPSSTNYYATLNNDTTKFYKNDTIYIPQRNVQVKLTIHKVDGTLAPTDLIWKRIDTTKCTNVTECFVSSNILGVTVMRVDSGTTILIKNPLAIYKMPTLYFKRGNNYDGEYGFDDSTHQYLNIRNANNFKNGYEVKHIMQDSKYFVPWMALVHQQAAVTIKDSLANFSPWAKKDVNGYIEFRANTNKITLSPIRQYYSNSNTINNLTISAQQWTSQLDSIRQEAAFDTLLYPQLLKSVFAITSTGDTIGKLNLSCSSSEKKPIVFVYVNTGNGFDSSLYSKMNMINQLNLRSHNQVFRKWEINSTYSDTLDLRAEFLADSSRFGKNNVDSMPEKMVLLYKSHKNINIFTLNQFNDVRSSNFVRFAFITTLVMKNDTIINGVVKSDYVRGITGPNFAGYTVLFKDPLPNPMTTVSHEFLHMLKADHTWESPYFVTQYSTLNLMDYAPLNSQVKRNILWYSQWIKIF